MSGIAAVCLGFCDQHRRAFRRRRGKIADHAALLVGVGIGNDNRRRNRSRSDIRLRSCVRRD